MQSHSIPLVSLGGLRIGSAKNDFYLCFGNPCLVPGMEALAIGETPHGPATALTPSHGRMGSTGGHSVSVPYTPSISYRSRSAGVDTKGASHPLPQRRSRQRYARHAQSAHRNKGAPYKAAMPKHSSESCPLSDAATQSPQAPLSIFCSSVDVHLHVTTLV